MWSNKGRARGKIWRKKYVVRIHDGEHFKIGYVTRKIY